MDYVTSRKKVYVPRYLDMMKGTEMGMYWKSEVEKGKDVVIFDFDGLLVEKINDVRFPFGHGYIVGSWIKGISIDKFI